MEVKAEVSRGRGWARTGARGPGAPVISTNKESAKVGCHARLLCSSEFDLGSVFAAHPSCVRCEPKELSALARNGFIGTCVETFQEVKGLVSCCQARGYCIKLSVIRLPRLVQWGQNALCMVSLVLSSAQVLFQPFSTPTKRPQVPV